MGFMTATDEPLRPYAINSRFRLSLRAFDIYARVSLSPDSASNMPRKAALRRLKIDLKSMVSDPPEFITAMPSESNMLKWHYVIVGPPDSPYQGGVYHGVLIFPPEYPMRPPEIRMLTPSGRFQPNTPLCLSMSSFHPETWTPVWNAGNVLVGLLSFMLEEGVAVGVVRASNKERRRLAAASHGYNLKDDEVRWCVSVCELGRGAEWCGVLEGVHAPHY